MKLPQFLVDDLQRHAVREPMSGYADEYLVAVCR
jgi:hypothetical protein